MKQIKKENPVIFIKAKNIPKDYDDLRELEVDIYFSKLIKEYEKIESIKE